MRVATTTGQPFAAVWHAPYSATLYQYLLIQQQDRVDDLRERGRRLHLGMLIALAFNEPKKLNEEHRALLRDIGALPTDEQSHAAHQAMLEELKANGWGVVQ